MTAAPRTVNWPVHRLFLCCAALLISLFVPVAQIHAQTQAAMNAQARAEFQRADSDLNKTYQSVLTKLPTVESKQKLREAQRAWVVSRDTEAARATKEADGGSMAPTLRYETMTHLTRERIKLLNNMLDHGTQNGPKLAASSATTSPSSTPEAASEQAQSVSETGSTSSSSASSVSPDKKWECRPDESASKIVEAGTNQMVLELSDQGPGNVLWAPDSKRFAYNWGQGRTHQTAFYQLRDDHWVALDFPGDNDEFEKQPNDIVAGQLKKEGLSEKKLEKQGKFLRLIWSSMNVDRWLDSNTAIVHVSLRQVAARRDAPGEMDNGYGADLLFTLKFDPSGKWKIVKTHRMSEKEVEEHQ